MIKKKNKREVPKLLPVLLCGHREHLVKDTVSNIDGQPRVAEEMPFALRRRVINQHPAHIPGGRRCSSEDQACGWASLGHHRDKAFRK